MEQVKSTISEAIESKVIVEQKLGKTVSYIAVDGVTLGFVSITDAIKNPAKPPSKHCKAKG